MKLAYCLFILALLLTSCSPSVDTVATSVAATVAAALPPQQAQVSQAVPQPTDNTAPTATQGPTSTPLPTNTPAPTKTVGPTETPAKSREQIRLEFAQLWIDVLEENVDDVEVVTMSRINNGRLEIELRTIWASQDSQPDISYDAIQIIAEILIGSKMSRETAAEIVGGDEFSVYLVTYSTDGDYQYESTTNYDTLVQVGNRSISYNEWVTASNAGFR